jgi:HAMP domain-containing protein/CheY-like chemotaxis protein/signal transduction histidine kinase
MSTRLRKVEKFNPDAVDHRELLNVLHTFRNGDFSIRLPAERTGIAGKIYDALNEIIDNNDRLNKELERINRAVGKEGKLTHRAALPKVTGGWAECIDSVNGLVADLVQPTADFSRVIGAVARGDLAQRMNLEIDGRALRGEFLLTVRTVNTMVDQLSTFTSEVIRVAREVGTEGKLGGQAEVKGLGGAWRDLTDNVNSMANNLTAQVRNIADVTTAVANGDLSKKITVDVRGEILELKNTINTMVDQLNSFASEVTRVAREVGTEGKLGGQAVVKGVGGTWKDLTDSVNFMAGNLTTQVRNIAAVTTAVANGDLSKKITVDVRGEILELKSTINTMVDQLNSFASEVTRVAREVGTEGKLGGQAEVRGVGGTWKDLTDSVNSMASNLTNQVRNIAGVTTAVANGDLSKKITVDARGEILELKNTINIMVDQLNSFASEVTRVAREVGTEGRLGGQADVKGVGGTWKDLTDSVNSMANNLTTQVRNIAEVTTAVARGDLSKKITVDVRGEILELKNTINTMVDQLNSFASEVTRVAREVGTDGRLGGQADVKGVGGTWKDLTDSVNFMASNLTNQVRNIAEVTTAVARGDLSKKITVDVRGEILELKNTINTMVDQLNSFASEVTRVAREVGTEGRLGGQAEVKGVGGTWKDLTDSVNFMASNLTNQVRNIAAVTTAVANGDLSKKITVDARGEILELKSAINTMVDQLNSFASEVTRVAREVGTEGKLGGQAVVRGVGGTWKDLTDNVNFMASNLTTQVRNIAAVTTAIANGDLSKKITVDVQGEILELKDTVNILVDQLNSFASEVTRVAREVGTEGRLGGQAEVRGVAGTWKDLTDSVNSMASNLTDQVRSISKVVKDVAAGNLKRKLVLEARGEIAELADTINEMIDTLATFADQVTTVAREVGVEGKLGGQANVPGATGTWRDLTDNVNRLAANLTTQVRAIAEVATAVTKWDLSRSITVEAAGEVASLKDNINEMIRNLRETTEKSAAQDWLKTNVAKFTRLLQGQRDLFAVSRLILSELAPLVSVQHGVFYISENQGGETELRLLASYAYRERKHLSDRFRLREGLVGQAAFEKQRILITEAPPDYIQISSGLGEARPVNIVVLPVLFEGEVKAVIELASFQRFNDIHMTFLEQLAEIVGIMLNTITATMRTEELLKQSQALATELTSRQTELTETNTRLQEQARTLRESEERLREQQEELKQTNEELEVKAHQLSEQNREVEHKNEEIELARRSLEEKAEQLSLSSKYKSEFLANMSHELRTPLNSMLILSKLLSDNPDRNLSAKQREYAKTIHESGSDLLSLINEILDLSKIEAGAMQIEVLSVPISDITEFVERSFRHVAEDRGIDFSITVSGDTPTFIHTDSQRLQQVLKNLLSNAFKFTEKGEVRLKVEKVRSGWNRTNEILNRAETVIAFGVIDTGIGIAQDKQQIVFEAFQQAEGGVNRKYGGTGLGLSISRELARLLGGEIRLVSAPSKGSTFTVYLPQNYPQLEADPRTPLRETSMPALGRDSANRTVAPPALAPPVVAEEPPSSFSAARVVDDRTDIQPNDQVVLIVEDDVRFARIMLDIAHESGFKGLFALNGEEALRLARKHQPAAITLDLHLPGVHGWSVLDRLKHDPATRHIPVQVISAFDERGFSLQMGAVGYLRKPATHEELLKAFEGLRKFAQAGVRNLLVVEDDEVSRNSMVDMIGNGDVHTITAGSGEEALKILRDVHIDCMVVDLRLPGMNGFQLIEKARELGREDLPIVVYTAMDLTKQEVTQLRRMTESIIIKEAHSLERLLDETSLFLHRKTDRMPEMKRKKLEEIRHADSILQGRKVLIIDDDIRNIFALTSLFEQYNMKVIYAENGEDGIHLLDENPDIDAALVDIMMPGIDGYETIRRMRQKPELATIPILALTAKAMKGDREACIQAGATDYVAKPADTEHLLSALRVHLSRQQKEA